MLDDDMEISSDRGQDIGDYIEIDEDLAPDADNDFMHDDDQIAEVLQDSNEHGEDDFMSDDYPSTSILENVITMENDLDFEDEELDDASTFDPDNLDITDAHDSGLGNAASDHVAFTDSRDAFPVNTANVENLHFELDFEEEAGGEEQTEEQAAEPGTGERASFTSPHKGGVESTASTIDAVDQETLASQDGSEEYEGQSTADTHAKENVYGTERPNDLSGPTYVGEHVDDGYAKTQSDNDSSTHPVVILWKGDRFPLFMPSDPDPSEQYFFSDASVYDEPLSEFLRGCRAFLGDNISEDVQLVAYFQKLGLTVSEDMADPPSETLNDLLNVYVPLIEQSQYHPQRPLYIELKNEFRFRQRLLSLHTAREEQRSLRDVEAVEAIDYEVFAEFPEEGDFADVDDLEEDFYEEEYDKTDEQEAQANEAAFENTVNEEHSQTAEEDAPNRGEGSVLLDDEHNADFDTANGESEANAANVAVSNEEETISGSSSKAEEQDIEVPSANPEISEVVHKSSPSTNANTKSSGHDAPIDEPKTNNQAREDFVEDDLDGVDVKSVDPLGDEEDFTHYPDDVLDDLDAPPMAGIHGKSTSGNIGIQLDQLKQTSILEKDFDIDPGVGHDVEDVIPAQETEARSEPPVLGQNDDVDEDELTFSEDELDDVQDQTDLRSDLTKVEIQSTPHESSLQSTNDLNTVTPSPPLLKSRKRSFGEHTELNLDDGGEQKKARPA